MDLTTVRICKLSNQMFQQSALSWAELQQANEGDAFKYCSSEKFEVRFVICSMLCYSVLLVCGETKTLIKLREEKLYKKINTNKGVNVDW